MAGETADDLGADEPAAAALASETGGILWEAADGLDEGDRVLLELHVRHGLEGAELAEAAGVAPGQISMATGRMRERVARSVGALLIARKGRADCPGLQVVLADWDGTYTVLTRKRVARHIDSCELCDERRTALVAPFGALAVGPTLVAFQLPDGALDGVRDRVLDAFDQQASGGGPGPAGSGDADGRGRRRALVLIAAVVLLLAAVIGAVATREDEGGALQTADAPTATTTAVAPDRTSTSAGRTSTTESGASTTTSTAVASPNQAGSTTVPGELTDPVDPAEGPQLTVPPSIGGPPVTLAPPTVASTAPNQPPTIGATSRTPSGSMQTTCNPANDTRTISVTASDDRGVAKVVLTWTQAGGGAGQRAMSQSGSTWTAPLGPFANPGTVTYRAVATDSNGATATSSASSVGVDPCPG